MDEVRDGVLGLSLFALCDAESSTIGCNAELNEIKIIIAFFKCPQRLGTRRALASSRGLRGLVGCLVGCSCSLHIAVGFACGGLAFEPVESIFLKIGLKKGTSMYYLF
jgi:hypothetical protein